MLAVGGEYSVEAGKVNSWLRHQGGQQKTDNRALRRINALLNDTRRQPFEGLGDLEPLKHGWSGYWSRRLNREHHLVYKVADEAIIVVQCRYHY